MRHRSSFTLARVRWAEDATTDRGGSPTAVPQLLSCSTINHPCSRGQRGPRGSRPGPAAPAPSSVNSRARTAALKSASSPLRSRARTPGSTSLRWTCVTRLPYAAIVADGIATTDEPVADVEAERDEIRRPSRQAAGRSRRVSRRTSRRAGGTPAGVPRRASPGQGRGAQPRGGASRPTSAAAFPRRRPGPARAGPLRRAVEGDAEHVAVARHEEAQPFQGDVESAVGRAVGRRRQRGVDLREPEVARGQGVTSSAPSGNPRPSWQPS